MKTAIKYFPAILLLSLASITMPACVSIDKLVESGQYDRAIGVSTRKLTGKRKKSPRLVAGLEEAFAKANQRDLALAERLKAADEDTNWSRIHDLYVGVDRRQELIQPLLPLMDKFGYQANFDFVEVAQLERESRSNAAAYHYNRAQELIEQARNNNDKLAARAAWREIEQIGSYYREYRNSRELQQQAHALGTVNILVAVENDAGVVAPIEFERRLRQINTNQLNSFWQQYYQQPVASLTFDYRMVLRIQDILVSPDLVKEREYIDEKEIEEGFDYVLDSRGNVLKDSLGNDVKIPKKIIIRAYVTEVYQSKQTQVNAVLDLIDLRINQVIQSQPLSAVALFENYASKYRGDERALTADSRSRIGNSPQPFPSAEAMILQAADRMKPVFQERVVSYRNTELSNR